MSDQLTLPSEQEVKDWLFDDLMGQIEPDLVSTNREATDEMLRSLSPEEIEKKIISYEEAFKKFVKQWPEYVRKTVAELNENAETFKNMIKEGDSENMSEIEQKFDSDVSNA